MLGSLHKKFGTNIGSLTQQAVELLERIELNCRAIDGAFSELIRTHCGDDRQKRECASLVQEIFADFSLAMYLFASGLIVPARMLIRRALELGIAVVYMWDLPHEYWGWKQHDEDLSYSKMIEHLASPRYLTHLAVLSGKEISDQCCDVEIAKKLYRKLSNTVHGKLDGLPPLSPERYSSETNQVEEQLKLAFDVQRLLIDTWLNRFPTLAPFIKSEFPATTRNKA